MNHRPDTQRIIIVALLAAALLLLFIYARQQLFTRNEPIVLAG